ncbi:MAG TPA: ribosome biogenesis GTP-binding protein YihA/YsxC [Candidatus Magasanikbacteria bacterium]|nr:ribosome biogenesis GTP-binding protein YihA/YsxC [Candidatus Magasanikbacteria bacterium]
MNIKSAVFVKGVTGTNEIFEDNRPQIVLIGRSNVGKSTLINTLTNQKNLAKTSSFPGRTQQINIFLINNSFYLIDLPGYGFAKVPPQVKEKISKMIEWYLFRSGYDFKKVILIIDAKVGPTADDLAMYDSLRLASKDVIVVANKIDKLKKGDHLKQIEKINQAFENHRVIPFSAETKKGLGELTKEII